MEAFIFVLLCILWFISGGASFIYWWTKEFDFTWDEFPISFIGGVVGPFTFLIGWACHGNPIFAKVFGVKDGVLFKKREKSS